MEMAFNGGLTVEFEAGELPSPGGHSRSRSRTYRIGWLVQSVDVNSASMRYRCFHFARALAPQFESVYLTSLNDVQKAIAGLDAIVVVKRIDRTVLDLVGLARPLGKPVFLDLCDDLIAPEYFKNEFGINLLHFLGIAPFLAGVTVSSAEMADRVAAYAADHGCGGLRVHVVPDIAETWPIYRSTAEFVTGEKLTADLPPTEGVLANRPKQVLWFGNYGASHSNFGMFSLKSCLKPLQAVNADIPLELVIVSNSETVYNALVHNCGFPARYVPWSPTAVYSALEEADVALLTTGDDEFCSIKSSNRIVQALAANVPVITPKSPALAEFEDALFSGRIEDSLRLCLGRSRARVVPQKLDAARSVLQRYTPERLGGIWASLFKQAIGKDRGRASKKPARKVLFLAEHGDNFDSIKAALTTAKSLPDLDYELLMSTELLEEDPRFNSTLRMPRSIPRFFSGRLKGARNLLLGRSAVVVDRKTAPIAKLISTYAEQLGVRVITTAEAASGALKAQIPARPRGDVPSSTITAGPFEEWTEADGSVEWSFVVHQNARGWILDAICREIGSRQEASWKVCYHPEPSAPAKNLFFSHYLLLESYLERHEDALANSKVFVWYTHPREEDPVKVAKLLLAFDRVSKVVFACESNRQLWLDRGLAEEKTAVVLGAADPQMFQFHERGSGVVGLSSSFYERKNPECLLDVVKLLPHREFVLLGRKWNQFALFEEMRALPNFTYLSAPYRDYPEIYSTFDVFLSMSNLEGGPIPLVEAMMSNAVPVASRTGFAPDLIRHGSNGFIFDLDASAEKIAGLIEEAFALEGDVRETVERYDWDRFSSEVVKLAK